METLLVVETENRGYHPVISILPSSKVKITAALIVLLKFPSSSYRRSADRLKHLLQT